MRKENEPVEDKTYLVSFSGEIGTKAPATRRALEELTLENLRRRAAASGIFLEIERFSGRLRVRVPHKAERLLLTHAGLGKVAELLEGSLEEIPSLVKGFLPGRPFTYVVYVDRVRPKEDFPRALELKRALLEVLSSEAEKRLLRWDNHPPERVEIRLEMEEGRVLALLNPRRGLSGLPVGSGERVLLLFSGGPDSLLSGIRLALRGQGVGLVFFDDGEPGRAEAVKEAARRLSYFFPDLKLPFFHLSFREALEFLSQRVSRRERCFFCKSAMLRISAEIAGRRRFSAVATGEILGEQASQTLPALEFTRRASGVSPLRPVLSFRKEEVFSELSALGLSEVAERALPPCPFAPDHPHTRPASSPGLFSRLFPEIRKRVKVLEYETASP